MSCALSRCVPDLNFCNDNGLHYIQNQFWFDMTRPAISFDENATIDPDVLQQIQWEKNSTFLIDRSQIVRVHCVLHCLDRQHKEWQADCRILLPTGTVST